MKALSITGSFLTATIVLTLLAARGAQQENQNGQPPDPTADAEVGHGRYLVHDVCMCVICHSPRDARGELIASRLLTGGTIPLESPYPRGDWAFRAPKLRGLPAGWSEEEFVRFLQTREAPRGLNVRLPMPPFHLNKRDARAVAAYLKSLN